MNDDDQAPSFGDPAFDDPAFDELRRLLADARVSEPVPAEVAARLDTVLASLRAERTAAGTVVPLRRRLAPLLVAAAAAVVVVAGGVGITQSVRNDAGQATSADKASSADAGGSTSESALAAPVPALTTAHFGQQVAGLGVARLAELDDTSAAAGETASRSPAPAGGDSPHVVVPQTGRPCAGPDLPGTRSTPILLDGRPAALLVHPVSDGAQRVDAWSCDGTERLATTTLRR